MVHFCFSIASIDLAKFQKVHALVKRLDNDLADVSDVELLLQVAREVLRQWLRVCAQTEQPGRLLASQAIARQQLFL